MLFNSYEFLFIFLPIVFFGYFVLLKNRWVVGAKLWLALASLAFYGYWNVNYVALILFSIVVNYVFGILLANEPETRPKLLNYPAQLAQKISAKTLVTLGIIFNLGLLGFFKYTDFFLENFNGVFGTNIPLPHILLPIGISFFTFTQIAFLVDAYKGKAKEYSFIHYVLFVSYFPHLLAGPILHHKEMMPQFASRWNWAIRWRNIAIGLFIFSIGLFKKVAIADNFAVWANAGFSNSADLHFIDAWITSLSYTFQLYYDFSGYTDMAIGISLLFNIKLPINFNSPYKALSIQDFWRRWHMTLSRFLRDYLYIPLGGNRSGKYRTYINLIITFLLGGIWHGAGWTFVIWGLLHGFALAIHRLWHNLGFKMYAVLAWIITFNFVNITWVFFRADSFAQAKQIIKAMLGLNGVVLPEKIAQKLGGLNEHSLSAGNALAGIGSDKKSILFILLGFILVLTLKPTIEFIQTRKVTLWLMLLASLAFSYSTIYSLLNSSAVFLYYNF